jgi:hypothetical protein
MFLGETDAILLDVYRIRTSLHAAGVYVLCTCGIYQMSHSYPTLFSFTLV